MTVRLEETEFGSFADWEAAAAAYADFHFYHSAPWLSFIQATQSAAPKFYKIVSGDGRLLGYLPGFVVRKGPLRIFGSPFPGWTTPYLGPVLTPDSDAQEVLPAILAQLRSDGYHHAEICHYGFDPGIPARGRCWRIPHTTIVAEIGANEEEIAASFSKSGRKALRRAVKDGLTVEATTDLSFIDEYYGQLRQVFAKSKMQPTYPIGRVQGLFEHVAPSGRLLALRVLWQDRCIATRIDFFGQHRMHSFGSASDQAHLHLFPNELARYHAMCEGAKRGLTTYDMTGRGSYKTKFNGQAVEVPVYVSSSTLLMAGRYLVRRLREAQRKRRAA